ncbi:MAG: pilus assembly FimT family protein [Enterovibrio sp.]
MTILKRIKPDAAKIKGFSMLELSIVLFVLALLSFVAVPKFLANQANALVESSVVQLFSMLDLAANESLRKSKSLYVHYLPQTNGIGNCIVVTENSSEPISLCSKSDLNQANFFKFNGIELLSPNPTTPRSLFYFSGATGLPSQDVSLYFGANKTDTVGSGIFIRRYKGLQGCSDTVITGWPKCK